MKVLFPATHYYPVIGGIENWTQNIAEKITGKADVFVVTGRVHPVKSREAGIPQDAELFNGVKIFRTSLFTLTNLSHSPLFYTLSLLPFIFFKSFYLIEKEKIDILHCQGFLSSLLGFLLSKITGIPYLVTVQRMERSGNRLKEFIYGKAAVCIGASRAVGEYFRKIGCKNVEVIPNGIDLKRFEGLERKPHEGFIVMTIARLEKVKGVRYLIEAISILNENYKLKTINYKLIIIGDGSERKNLESLTRELGLSERIRFFGEIPPEGIPEYLAMADCFVLPSLKEGFGIAVLEAMASGVPVAASRVGGILDIIEDGKNGLLTEPGNPEKIAQAISKIYQDSALRIRLNNNAMALLFRYDWRNIADKVYKLYEDCIRRRYLSA